MMPIPMPESSWSSVAVDLCCPFPTGETLLILVDYYSRFPIVEILKSKTSANIISKLFKIFSVPGLPEILTIENGGQFISNEIESYLKINGITHNKTTLLWLQENGQVEQINRVIKLYNRLLTKDVIGNKNWVHSCLASETLLGTSYQLFQVLLIVSDSRGSTNH